MNLIIDIIPCLSDNYAYIIYDNSSKKVGVIDPSNFDEVNDVLKKKYNKLDYIMNTHHHMDHTGGNKELKKNIMQKLLHFPVTLTELKRLISRLMIMIILILVI